MSTLSIFDELVNSGFETNVLKTREGIIMKLALGHIKLVVSARKRELEKMRFEVLSHKEMYCSIINVLDENKKELLHKIPEATKIYTYGVWFESTNKKKNFEAILEANDSRIRCQMLLNLRVLCSNFKVILNDFGTLESEFPPNIFLWKDIREVYNFETISPDTELLLSDVFVDKMKQLDIKYENLKKEFNDVIFENYLHPLKFHYGDIFKNFDKIIAVLAKSLELDFDTI
jgi:hypothetical protein